MGKIAKNSSDDGTSQTSGAEIASLAVTMGASIASMWLHVRETFYKKIQKDVLKPQFDQKKKEITALGDKLLGGTITTEQFSEQLQTLKTTHRENWEANIKKMGINSWGDKLGYLNRYEKTKTAIIGATVLSVGMGAILTLRSQHRKHEETTQQVEILRDQMASVAAR